MTQLIRNPVHLLAFGFGAGLSPKAPGTVGTLVAVPIYCLLAANLSLPVYAIVTILFIVAGCWICGKTARDLGVHDHGGIVWDEIAGFMCALLGLPLHWINVVLAFALFRLFDIWKPWPISWLDRRVKGGVGIMLDDVAAGLLSCVCIHLVWRIAAI